MCPDIFTDQYSDEQVSEMIFDLTKPSIKYEIWSSVYDDSVKMKYGSY